MPRYLTLPFLIFSLAMVLVTLGLITVYSASAQFSFFVKQVMFAGIGLVALLLCYTLDYQYFRRFAPALMLATLMLCLLVFVPGVGQAAKGANRWIGFGGLRLQPSEFAKLGLVIYMAKMLADRRQYLKSLCSGLLPAAAITGLFVGVIVIEPDFGAAFVLGVVIFGMWLAAEMRWFHLMLLPVAVLPAGVYAFLSEPYRIKRLLAFMFRDEDTLMGAGYQLYQSLIAVGSGGLWGLGLGESKQKFHYLTEAHTDFVFAIMGEELGFIKLSCIVLLYAALVMIGWWIALRSTDLFGSLLAAGVTLMIFCNTAIHMAVVLGLLPTKGLVLPFISAGGSSLIVSMAAIGLLMNIARNQHAHAQHGRDEAD